MICIDKGKNLLVLDMEKSTYGKISRGDYGLSSHTHIVLVCNIYTASYGGPHSYISSGLFFFFAFGLLVFEIRPFDQPDF